MTKERWSPSDPGYPHLIKAEETAYTSEGVLKLIDVMARSGYSCRNSLLVYGQIDDCKLESISDLRSEEAWEKVGRSVDLYKSGFLISMPSSSPFAAEGEVSYTEQAVFDVSQTQGNAYEPIPKSGYLQNRGFVYTAKYILASIGMPKERVVKESIDLPVDYDLSTGKLIFSDTVPVQNTDALAWYAYARAKVLFSDRNDPDNMAKAVYQITARQIGAPIDEKMQSFSLDGADYKTISDIYQASTGMLHRIEKELMKSQEKAKVQEGGLER